MKNLISVSLKEPKTMEELSKLTGIAPEKLEPFIEMFVEKDKIKKDNNKYSLV